MQEAKKLHYQFLWSEKKSNLMSNTKYIMINYAMLMQMADKIVWYNDALSRCVKTLKAAVMGHALNSLARCAHIITP